MSGQKQTRSKRLAAVTKYNAMWSSLWNEKGPHLLAMETAREKLKNPLYTTYFGENGNFHKPGNTNASRKQRINTQRRLVDEYVRLLRSAQPRTVNYNRKQAVGNAYVRAMQTNRLNAVWNNTSPSRRAIVTADRIMRNPSYAITPEEIGNFHRKTNNREGVARKQRVDSQLRLIMRELESMKERCDAVRRMKRAGGTVPIPEYCRHRP